MMARDFDGNGNRPLQKSLDRALFLCIFKREVRLDGVRASISVVHIRKWNKL